MQDTTTVPSFITFDPTTGVVTATPTLSDAAGVYLLNVLQVDDVDATNFIQNTLTVTVLQCSLL